MNADFGKVTDSLDGKQKRIVTPQPTSHCFPKANVKAQAFVVSSQEFVPAVVNPDPFKTQKRNVDRCLHQSYACAPNIKVSVSTPFNRQEHERHQCNQNQREGRVRGAAKGNREGNSGGGDSPVGRRIEPGSPDLASVHLTSVKMSQHAQLSTVERTLGCRPPHGSQGCSSPGL